MMARRTKVSRIAEATCYTVRRGQESLRSYRLSRDRYRTIYACSISPSVA